MTRSEILRIVATFGWLLAVAMLAAERRIVRRLRRAGATTPDRATTLALWSPVIRLRLARLVRSGAVISSSADRFYLDPDGFARYRRRRRRRALTVLAVLLPLMGAFWWFSNR